jgi:hypothetical protein
MQRGSRQTRHGRRDRADCMVAALRFIDDDVGGSEG